MRTTYKFYAWSPHGGAGDAWAWVNVDWTYDRTAKRINITGISYAGDRWGNPGQWYVGATMKFGIRWSDGTESVLVRNTYNYPYKVTSGGGGFITKNGVLGVFTDANAHLTSHTFSGNSGGFTVWFGSDAGTLNEGNPQPYKQLEQTSGDGTNVTFATPPSINNITLTASNPAVYKLTGGISGINWGTGYSRASLVGKVKYTLDGKAVEYTAFTGGAGNGSFSIDAQGDTVPWDRVPDDETVTIVWTISTDIGTVVATKTQYCQTQYEVFVIDEKINSGQPVASDMFTSVSAGGQPTKGVRRIWQIGGSEDPFTRDYKQVEYILSESKDAYIDTGLTGNGAYEITAEGSTGPNDAGLIFDAYENNNYRTGNVIYNRARSRIDYWWTGKGYSELDTVTAGIDLTNKFTIKQDYRGITVTQGAKTASATYTGNQNINNNIHLLIGKSERTDINPSYTRIFSLQVVLGGTLIRDFCPVKRKSDGAVGFYDKIESKFYPSDGSAEFIAGPEV